MSDAPEGALRSRPLSVEARAVADDLRALGERLDAVIHCEDSRCAHGVTDALVPEPRAGLVPLLADVLASEARRARADGLRDSAPPRDRRLVNGRWPDPRPSGECTDAARSWSGRRLLKGKADRVDHGHAPSRWLREYRPL